MGDVMARKTSKRYRKYHQQIVFELLGDETPEESARWFEHGKEMEPYARGAYEWKYGVTLTPNVFCIHPDYDWLACSPDGLPIVKDAKTGGPKKDDDDNPVIDDTKEPAEIKCRAALPTYLKMVDESIRLDRIDPTYKWQVQAQLWVMGVPQLDYIEYYHDNEQRIRKMHVTTVKRDDALISQMETRCLEFMLEAYKLAEIDTGRLAA